MCRTSSGNFARALTVKPRLSGQKLKQMCAPWAGFSEVNSFELITFNCRSLLCAAPAASKLKSEFLITLFRPQAVLCLQEVRGDWHRLLQTFPEMRLRYYTFASFVPGTSAGGVAILLPMCGSRCAAFADPTDFGEPGRLLRIAFDHPHGAAVFYNCHLESLSRCSARRFAKKLGEDINRAQRDPVNYAVFIAGDFNRQPAGISRLGMLAPGDVTATVPFESWRKPIEKQLGRMTELLSGDVTHYHAKTESLGSIDRIFTSIPDWILCQNSQISQALFCPKALNTKGISDHSPVLWSISARAPVPFEERPVPSWTCRTKAFKLAHDQFCDYIDLDKMSPTVRLQTHETILREAARISRDASKVGDSLSPAALVDIAVSIARAVWSSNLVLATTLLRKHTLAQEHLSTAGCMVTLREPEKFYATYRSLRLQLAESTRREINIEASSSSPKTRRRANARRIGLEKSVRRWSPFGRLQFLDGLTIRNVVISEGDARQAALREEWSPLFAKKHVPRKLVDEFVKENISTFDFSSVPPPAVHHYLTFLAHCADSAPGPDGLPYSAWRFAGLPAAETLARAAAWLYSGRPLHFDFYLLQQYFLIKKSKMTDAPGNTFREPSELRPIGCKNTSNKIIAGVAAHRLSPVISQSIVGSQRGFV